MAAFKYFQVNISREAVIKKDLDMFFNWRPNPCLQTLIFFVPKLIFLGAAVLVLTVVEAVRYLQIQIIYIYI